MHPPDLLNYLTKLSPFLWSIQTEYDLDQAEADRVAVLAGMNERNLVALLEDIVQRCQGILIPASGAVVRRVDANTSPLHSEPSVLESPHPLADDSGQSAFMHRERIVETVRSQFYTPCRLG